MPGSCTTGRWADRSAGSARRETTRTGTARRAVSAPRVATTNNILAAVQCVLPGERTSPHRHTPAAVRLVLEGSGGATFVDGVRCDVVCTGRFYDFLSRDDTEWTIVRRQPIYEKDRMDAVVPGQIPPVDQAVLETFPSGCRHLLYCQTTAGMKIHIDVPGLHGREVQELYSDGRRWLDGETLPR